MRCEHGSEYAQVCHVYVMWSALTAETGATMLLAAEEQEPNSLTQESSALLLEAKLPGSLNAISLPPSAP